MSSARIVIIGNEVLSGEIRDENIHFLAGELSTLGTRVAAIHVVPDEDQAIVEVIRSGITGSARVLVTGGIGPTHDDRTRAAVALSLDLPLISHPEALERLRTGYGSRITRAELAMAELPSGARLLVGRTSGVFGFAVGPVYVFPGVPSLLRDIFPAVSEEFRSRPDHRLEITTCCREGDFADRLAGIQEAFPDVAIGSYPVHGENGWIVRLTLKGLDPARVEDAASRVRRILE